MRYSDQIMDEARLDPAGRQPLFRETIFALSSGRLPAGVAVIRVSGAGVVALLGRTLGHCPLARKAVLAVIRDDRGALIDRGLVLFFPSPASFTGEDVVEFHLHGGRAVVAAMLDYLGVQPGFRQAEPGEFTRRAFLLGRMDLTEAEALGDLVAAETEAQRRFALENAAGKQSALYLDWRRRIIEARAFVEATLDFSDEGDVPEALNERIWGEIAGIAREIEVHIAGYHRAEIIQDGFQVVIVGAPNAGKSSLLNALARRDAAIISDEPGTTRDLVQVALDLDGVKVVLTDTAGIREEAGAVEAIGIAKAREKARDADLVLELEDLSVEGPVALEFITGARILRVATKADCPAMRSAEAFDYKISVLSGEGMDSLLAEIAACAKDAISLGMDALPSKQRHLGFLNTCSAHLRSAAFAEEVDLELRAEELRLGSDALGKLVGVIGTEDILDAIFSSFCIGK